MEGPIELVYNCDVCSHEITGPRIHCMTCENYDLCLNCYSSGLTSGMHKTWHEQHTIQPVAPLIFTIPLNTVEPRNPIIHHLPPPDRYWGHMITPQKTASQLFARLLDAIYTYVDCTFEPRQTTWLEPEKCSVIMDMLGYTPEENAFRIFYQRAQQNGRGVAWSDHEIAHIYEQYGWDHQMVTRVFQQHESYLQPTPDGMPLLSRKGFIAMMVGDALCDPDEFYARFNGLLGQVPALVDPATGEYFLSRNVPRSCWPSVPDKEELLKNDMEQQERVERMRAEILGNMNMGYEYSQASGGQRFANARELCTDGRSYFHRQGFALGGVPILQY